MLAHPPQLRLTSAADLEHFVKRLVEAGLDGIETRHCDHSAQQVEQYEKLAKKLGLLTSGGSDFHGSRKAVELGSQRVPYEVYERLRASRPGQNDES